MADSPIIEVGAECFLRFAVDITVILARRARFAQVTDGLRLPSCKMRAFPSGGEKQVPHPRFAPVRNDKHRVRGVVRF